MVRICADAYSYLYVCCQTVTSTTNQVDRCHPTQCLHALSQSDVRHSQLSGLPDTFKVNSDIGI